jgi:hypothetical protein
MNLRSTCTAAALLLGTLLAPAWAQNTTPGTDQPGSTTPGAASPATPPTHPTMRDTPTTAPDQNSSTAAQPKKPSSLSEARQACKNLSGEQAQKDCNTKAEQDFKNKSSTSTQ